MNALDLVDVPLTQDWSGIAELQEPTSMSNTYPPILAYEHVESGPSEEQRERKVRLTLFRILAVFLPLAFLIPKVVVTVQGNNPASGILELFGGLIGIGLCVLGFCEPVAKKLPNRWHYYLFTYAIYIWRYKTQSADVPDPCDIV